MPYTDDPVRDFEMHDARQTIALNRRPVCDCCKEHIQSEECYVIYGEFYCPDCMKDFLKQTEDYME